MITRAEAIRSGASRYFTGVPCKRGHVAERYVASKTCRICADANAQKTKDKNPDKYLALVKVWQKANPDRVAKYQLLKNRKNPARRNKWTADYRAAKDQRAPEWLTDAQMFEMECVYAYCSAMRHVGLDYHVDHIVPLRGDAVSGLHVPWNLQVLPGRENMSKGNSFHG